MFIFVLDRVYISVKDVFCKETSLTEIKSQRSFFFITGGRRYVVDKTLVAPSCVVYVIILSRSSYSNPN